MADGADPIPAGALADVAYLARSENRVRLLGTLASGAWTRRDLCDETGVARATVDRTVTEFENRGWATRTTDGAYVATATGREVAAQTRTHLESMATIDRLGELVDWFRTEEGSVDLPDLADATVHRPTDADPTATVEYMTDLLRASDTFRCVVGVAPPVPFEEAMRDGTVERDLATEHVITDAELAAILEQPSRVRRWREYLAGGANVYRYDGAAPCNVLVFDGTVVVGNTPSDVAPPFTVVESDHEAVLGWATGLVDSYRERAEPIDPAVFADAAAAGTGDGAG